MKEFKKKIKLRDFYSTNMKNGEVKKVIMEEEMGLYMINRKKCFISLYFLSPVKRRVSLGNNHDMMGN